VCDLVHNNRENEYWKNRKKLHGGKLNVVVSGGYPALLDGVFRFVYTFR